MFCNASTVVVCKITRGCILADELFCAAGETVVPVKDITLESVRVTLLAGPVSVNCATIDPLDGLRTIPPDVPVLDPCETVI